VTVSPRKSTDNPGGAYRKPRPDIYTMFLVIALLAILVSILFLYLHMQAYNFELKGGPPVAMILDRASRTDTYPGPGLGIQGSEFGYHNISSGVFPPKA
jgi:hypothetical protein